MFCYVLLCVAMFWLCFAMFRYVLLCFYNVLQCFAMFLLCFAMFCYVLLCFALICWFPRVFEGPGGFQKLQEACGKKLHYSWCLEVFMVPSDDHNKNSGNGGGSSAEGVSALEGAS